MNTYPDIQIRTKDPENRLLGNPVPALTTLLYKVCDQDQNKFEEATRLVDLFIEEALEEIRRDL